MILPLAIAGACVTACVLACARAPAPAPTTSGAERAPQGVVFRRRIDDKFDLVLTRQAIVPAADLPWVVPNAAENHTKDVFSITVALAPRRGAPLTLAARLVCEGDRQGGFEVLDALIGPGCVVLAAAEDGDLELWRITPALRLGASEIAVLNQLAWTRFAAFARIDHTTVAVKLAWGKERLIEATVDDLRPNFKRRTHFRQSPGQWKFESVGQKGTFYFFS